MTYSPDISAAADSYEQFLWHSGLTQQDMDVAAPQVPIDPVSCAFAYACSSPISGKGMFAAKDVDGVLGEMKTNRGWTELGRYTNHSNYPNAEAIVIGDVMLLRATAKAHDELTVNYFQVKKALSNPHRVLVVDDFCEHIDYVVQSAHNAGFSTWLPNKGDVGSSVYEGMGFWGDHAAMLKPLILNFGAMVLPNSMFFRVTNEGMEQAYIHSDRESGNYTCVVYLSQHAEPYGTAFYRHKPTGLVEMPSFQEMQEMGVFEELKQDMVSRDPDKWELLRYVEGQRNRAIIFDAPMFHSRWPLEGIGKDASDGRLIWASHFYTMDGYGNIS